MISQSSIKHRKKYNKHPLWFPLHKCTVLLSLMKIETTGSRILPLTFSVLHCQWPLEGRLDADLENPSLRMAD